MPKVYAEISTSGEVRLEGEGFQGKSCAGVIDRLAAAMGANTDGLQHEWKPEALESNEEQISGG